MPGTKKCSSFQEDHFNSEGADFIPKTKIALRDVNSFASCLNKVLLATGRLSLI
jgi:hypothetical protein